ncbi:lipid asymmetry maintenance protein MlaB [Sutterella sp.]|uniref:STAS domain-containing protein n=1 Tax=Sutterella sp. TaxID=1981025 RepID=UPI0026E0C04B|nr:STAS domain-containing protein [Sutterella sp.]MDO5531280.1 STAS domain-containing protein [Sutterella sp.]
MKVTEEVLNFENAVAFKASLLKAIDAGDLSCDLSNVKRADSAALSALLSARRRAKALGRDYEIRGLPSDLVTLARLYGVTEILAAS